MQSKVDVDYLITTTNRSDIVFYQRMNIHGKTFITNQGTYYGVTEAENCVMVTTPTRGVGINRNIGLALTQAEYALIVDDDMVFYDDANDIIQRALSAHPDADVIIFNFDYVKDGKAVRPRMKSAGSINFFNCLNYGICCTLIKNYAIRKNNISFSTLFGGGCIYSCGEDSLFFLDCVRGRLKVYTYLESIGRNEYRESSWFQGYNEKFFFDKGAWIACAFPKLRALMKWYFIIRLGHLSSLPLKAVIREMNAGIKGFNDMRAFHKEEAK